MTTGVTRRGLVATAAAKLAGATLAASLGTAALAQEKITLRLSSPAS